MLSDPDYYVRLQVALRVRPVDLFSLAEDTDSEVRRVVAARIPAPHHLKLKNDPDPLVRIAVLERLAPERWMEQTEDSDIRVRFWLAEHASGETLLKMASDPDPFIREIANGRVNQSEISAKRVAS
jgi:hypothetical protein